MSQQPPYPAGPQYPAGWYADPQGRFEQRYFDGANWTPHVTRDGVASVDAASAAMAVPPAGGWANAGSATGWGATGLGYGRRVTHNKIGLGLLIALVGVGVFAGAALLPWVGGDSLANLQEVRTLSGPTPASILWQQFGITVIWLVLALLGTTLPYQPGKIMGFFLGSLIGLGVCWRPVDRHDVTARANALVACLSPLWMFSMWYRTRQVTNQAGPYFHASFGPGLWVALGGMVILVAGAIVGRRHVLVTQ